MVAVLCWSSSPSPRRSLPLRHSPERPRSFGNCAGLVFYAARKARDASGQLDAAAVIANARSGAFAGTKQAACSDASPEIAASDTIRFSPLHAEVAELADAPS